MLSCHGNIVAKTADVNFYKYYKLRRSVIYIVYIPYIFIFTNIGNDIWDTLYTEFKVIMMLNNKLTTIFLKYFFSVLNIVEQRIKYNFGIWWRCDDKQQRSKGAVTSGKMSMLGTVCRFALRSLMGYLWGTLRFWFHRLSVCIYFQPCTKY